MEEELWWNKSSNIIGEWECARKLVAFCEEDLGVIWMSTEKLVAGGVPFWENGVEMIQCSPILFYSELKIILN